jgi:putative transposase
VTLSVILWIDVFIRPEYKNIIVDSLNYCSKNKGLEVYAWCVMTSHIHLIIGCAGDNKMEDIIRDLKRHTSKTLLKAIHENSLESRRKWLIWFFERAGKRNPNNKNFQFWQQHNHPIELYSSFMMDQKLEYVHNNPVAAGIVARPEDYLYSSAMDYSGGKGMVDILHIG